MKIYVRFETGQEDKFSEDYGPFQWAQMTYDTLNVSRTDDDNGQVELASFSKGWWRAPDGVLYSDFVVYPRLS